jgi:hypothetical protein
MLVNLVNGCFIYMEVPRTGSTTVDRALRNLFPKAAAPAGKHWPIRWQQVLSLPASGELSPRTVITLRNPYSRAVSCWQFFTDPAKVDFEQWLREVDTDGFVNLNIEAGPQVNWWQTNQWTNILRTETLEQDFNTFLRQIGRLAPDAAPLTLRQWNKTGGDWRNRVGVIPKRTQPIAGYYTQTTRELVGRIYAADFELGSRLDFDWSFQAILS